MKRRNALVLLLIVCLGNCAAVYGQRQKELPGMQVLYDPKVVMIDGWLTVYYELRLTSHSKDSIVLQKLDILTGDGVLIESLGNEEISKRYNKETTASGMAILPPYETAIIYIETDLHIVPDGLNHRLTFTTMHRKRAKTSTVEGGSIGHLQPTSLMISAPLSGGAWAAAPGRRYMILRGSVGTAG